MENSVNAGGRGSEHTVQIQIPIILHGSNQTYWKVSYGFLVLDIYTSS